MIYHVRHFLAPVSLDHHSCDRRWQLVIVTWLFIRIGATKANLDSFLLSENTHIYTVNVYYPPRSIAARTPDDQRVPDNDRYSKLKYLRVEYPLQHLIS